jgi:hypothetical protein
MYILIKMDLQEVGWGDMDWIDMGQDRDIWWASGSIKLEEFLYYLRTF